MSPYIVSCHIREAAHVVSDVARAVTWVAMSYAAICFAGFVRSLPF